MTEDLEFIWWPVTKVGWFSETNLSPTACSICLCLRLEVDCANLKWWRVTIVDTHVSIK